MNLRDKYLHWLKRRAIKRHNHAAYFRMVGIISKREVDKMVKEKLSKS